MCLRFLVFVLFMSCFDTLYFCSLCYFFITFSLYIIFYSMPYLFTVLIYAYRVHCLCHVRYFFRFYLSVFLVGSFIALKICVSHSSSYSFLTLVIIPLFMSCLCLAVYICPNVFFFCKGFVFVFAPPYFSYVFFLLTSFDYSMVFVYMYRFVVVFLFRCAL